jgi:hypothetical protein
MKKALYIHWQHLSLPFTITVHPSAAVRLKSTPQDIPADPTASPTSRCVNEFPRIGTNEADNKDIAPTKSEEFGTGREYPSRRLWWVTLSI